MVKTKHILQIWDKIGEASLQEHKNQIFIKAAMLS